MRKRKLARIPTAEALKKAEIKPLTLEAKEAISLINGTQAMLGIGTLALLAAETLADSADVIGSMTLDALRGTDVAFDERIHRARPHAGQISIGGKSAKDARGQRDSRIASRVWPGAGCLFFALHAAGTRRSARHADLLPVDF